MDRPLNGGASSVPPDGREQAPHLLHVFPSYGYGGVPIRIAGVINRLGARYRHSILALDGNLASGSRLDPARGVALFDPALGKGGLLGTLAAIRARLHAARPDLLLTYNWGAVEWALANTLFGFAPHVHFESGFGPEEAERQIPRRVWMRRIALRRARWLVVPSFTLVAIARDIWRIPAAKVLHIPNGVDCTVFGGPGDATAVPGHVAGGGVVIGTVAPLRVEKNIARLIRVFARLHGRSRARLLIAGDGPERPALELLTSVLGIADRVIFAGHVERPETVYPLFDVFAITSDTEQMPNTVIQAMAAGRAVAGLDVGDVRAILSPENGALIAPRGDEAALGAALDRMVAEAGLRDALGAANRRHVLAHYSQDRMVERYGALFDAALASRPLAVPADLALRA